MRRAVLIVNPFSTAVTQERVAEVEAVLRTRVELETHHTEAPGHATELAISAAETADAVVVFSGDGTYNEAINGAAGLIPFGFLPGGGASVLPRALGLPREPRRSGAAELRKHWPRIERARSASAGSTAGGFVSLPGSGSMPRRCVVSTGAAGVSTDGVAHNTAFVTAVFEYLWENRFRLEPQLEIVGQGNAAFVLVGVGRPYTYAGPMAVTLGGETRYDGGLDFVGPKKVSPMTVPRVLGRALLNNLHSDSTMLSGQDVDRIEVRCLLPLPLEADGEDLGDVTEAIFEAERNALDVLV